MPRRPGSPHFIFTRGAVRFHRLLSPTRAYRCTLAGTDWYIEQPLGTRTWIARPMTGPDFDVVVATARRLDTLVLRLLDGQGIEPSDLAC
jgi:hypothetical protein